MFTSLGIPMSKLRFVTVDGSLYQLLKDFNLDSLRLSMMVTEHDAKKARPHWLLTGVIRAGCRGAIWASEKI